MLVEAIEDPWLEALENHTIGALDLAVGSRVGNRGPIHTDVMLVAEVQELLAGELRAIVGYDDVRDPKAVYDVSEERDHLLRLDAGDRSGLDPFGELVDGHQQVCVAPGCPF